MLLLPGDFVVIEEVSDEIGASFEHSTWKYRRGVEEEVVVSCFSFHIYSVSEMNMQCYGGAGNACVTTGSISNIC
jgi:hypothetical protein